MELKVTFVVTSALYRLVNVVQLRYYAHCIKSSKADGTNPSDTQNINILPTQSLFMSLNMIRGTNNCYFIILFHCS